VLRRAPGRLAAAGSRHHRVARDHHRHPGADHPRRLGPDHHPPQGIGFDRGRASMEVLERLLNVTLVIATIRTTAPILLVALGGSFTTKAGIFNIGLEGQMLVGAFFAVIGTIATGSPWLGVLCGIAAALTLALIFALLVVTFKANEVVVGLALNILAGGLTISLMKAIFGTRGSLFGPGDRKSVVEGTRGGAS